MTFLEIRDSFFKKKLLFSGIGVLLFIGIGAVWFILHQEQADVAKEETEKKTSEELQKKLEKLQEVEGAIGRTQKELETLSTLSPEEKTKRERERAVLSAQKATDDVPIEGVEVVVENTKKIVTNKKEGYRIEVPSRLFIARSIESNWIELHDKDLICQNPSCEPVMRIRVETRNPDELTIGEWLTREERKVGAPVYSPREQFIIQGEPVYRVSEEIPTRFEGYYYYWGKGKKVYDIRISTIDDESYRPYIHTFSFFLTQ